VKGSADEVLRFGAESHEPTAPAGTGELVQSEALFIVNPNGLHARPAAQLVTWAKRFQSRITLHKGQASAAATSVTEIMALDLARGDQISLSARGHDAKEALAALKSVIESGLGEDLGKAPPVSSTRKFVSSSADVLGGVAAAPGVAIGRTKVRAFEVPQFETRSTRPVEEQQKLRRAIAAAELELKSAQAVFEQKDETEKAQIFAAHAALLGDDAFERDATFTIRDGASAPAAWQAVIADRSATLAALNSPLMRQRADDLRDVGHRVLLKVLGLANPVTSYEKGTVLVCDELTPSDVADLDPAVVVALVTRHGGSTSHAAIIARSLGVPYVAGLGDALEKLASGSEVIVDGDQGFVRLNPAAAEVEQAKGEILRRDQLRVERLGRAYQPARTVDGRRVEIGANIGSAKEATQAVEQGADGVGLLRSEFLFMNRRWAPSEDEQRAQFELIGKTLGGGRTLVVRTLDVGGDKPLSYMPIAPEENPFLGIRGLRLSLRYPELFAAQVRAILAAAPHTQLQVMFPMVASLQEFRAAKACFVEEMQKARIAPNLVSLGIMVEVPSAALLADAFANEVDFFSIGTNDLTQYTLAMDRGHAELAASADALDPAVLRLIAMTVQAAHAKKRWVGVCGGLAAELLATPLLVGLDIDELSVPSPSIPELKAAVRGLNHVACRKLASEALQLGSAAQVRALLSNFKTEETRGQS